jgi:alpha-L-fucosidase
MAYKFFVCIVVMVFTSYSIRAQDTTASTIKTSDAILNDFMDQRFGLFIHWGPVTLRGTEIGWSRNHGVPESDYDSLYREFDPVLFNADEWVKTAKEAGVKYLTITAKHHDGFCLWPSAFTKYNIQNTPFKRDVVGLLSEACKKYGVKFCVYYSILDWYQPDYPLHDDGDKTPDSKADMARFILYMKNQLKELINNYHPYMLWFDGNWEAAWKQEMGVDIYSFIKKLDPNIIINNRLGKGTHKFIGPESVGDYSTPEQEIGQINMADPWESCITICTQWAWKPNDKMKSLGDCICTLSRTAGGNGNLLLNVGPMPDGRIEKRQTERLKQIGDWLTINGAAIFGTRGGPYKPDSVFSSTRSSNRLFIHLYSYKNKELIIPAIPGSKPIKAYFLDGGDTIKCGQSDNNMSLSWSINMPDPICSVLVIEMDKNIDSIPIIQRGAGF